MKAMILAAGLGSRFKPWTNEHPKALAPVNGMSLLERNIRYLQRAGIFEVVVNVHHFAGQIIDEIKLSKGWGSDIIVSDETDEVLETGGGLKKAENLLSDGVFVLMNADVLTDLDLGTMIAFHGQLQPMATLATTVRKTSRYFLFDHLDNLCGWRNTNTGEEKIVRTTADAMPRAFSGIHVIDPGLFRVMEQRGRFSMVDVYLSLAGSEIIKSFDHSGSAFIDVGKPESVEQAERFFK